MYNDENRVLEIVEELLKDNQTVTVDKTDYRLLLELKNKLQLSIVEGKHYGDLLEVFIMFKDKCIYSDSFQTDNRIDSIKELLELKTEISELSLLRI